MIERLTLNVLKNPCVRCRTDETLGLAALFVRCGDGNGVIESLVILPVHSLQLNSDADLLKCLRNDEHRPSRFNFDFSKKKDTTISKGYIFFLILKSDNRKG